MAEIIDITNMPVRVTAATKQDLRLCFDAEDLDEVDLFLLVSEGTSVAVKVTTNMQNESENGWIDMSPTFSATSANGSAKINLKNFLRYLRWEVTSAGNATFTIAGMGRRWA